MLNASDSLKRVVIDHHMLEQELLQTTFKLNPKCWDFPIYFRELGWDVEVVPAKAGRGMHYIFTKGKPTTSTQ
jgi:hypothetical protein